MALKRIIVDYDDEYFSPDESLLYVSRVIIKGRISLSAKIRKYCHACFFGTTVVIARDRRHEDAADSFLVYKEGSFPGYRKAGNG